MLAHIAPKNKNSASRIQTSSWNKSFKFRSEHIKESFSQSHLQNRMHVLFYTSLLKKKKERKKERIKEIKKNVCLTNSIVEGFSIWLSFINVWKRSKRTVTLNTVYSYSKLTQASSQQYNFKNIHKAPCPTFPESCIFKTYKEHRCCQVFSSSISDHVNLC